MGTKWITFLKKNSGKGWSSTEMSERYRLDHLRVFKRNFTGYRSSRTMRDMKEYDRLSEKYAKVDQARRELKKSLV